MFYSNCYISYSHSSRYNAFLNAMVVEGKLSLLFVVAERWWRWAALCARMHVRPLHIHVYHGHWWSYSNNRYCSCYSWCVTKWFDIWSARYIYILAYKEVNRRGRCRNCSCFKNRQPYQRCLPSWTTCASWHNHHSWPPECIPGSVWIPGCKHDQISCVIHWWSTWAFWPGCN